jgi:hypothetical protein
MPARKVPTVFGVMQIRSARRAKENSPAIYRSGTVAPGKVPKGTTGCFGPNGRKQSGISFVLAGLSSSCAAAQR